MLASPSGPAVAISVSGLSHSYASRQAITELDFDVAAGEMFALLGPNGGGKTTLFRLLCTLIPPQQGQVKMLGLELAQNPLPVRKRIGVVFQAPSLDRKLTVAENLRHQAALYGVRGSLLRRRERELLAQLGLEDRRHDLAETLSGGLRRRVELAKGMIHDPEVLLMDEPSTGLDPGARHDLGRYLARLKVERQVTVVLTTHILEEAERADRIGILHQGRLVALDTPAALQAAVGGDSITMECDRPDDLATAIRQRFQLPAAIVDGRVRVELADANPWVGRLAEAFGQQLRSITLARPSLEDVFIQRTGHRFWQTAGED